MSVLKGSSWMGLTLCGQFKCTKMSTSDSYKVYFVSIDVSIYLFFLHLGIHWHYDYIMTWGYWYYIGVGCTTSYSQVILCSIAANRDMLSVVSPKLMVFTQAEMMVIFLLILYTYVYSYTVYISYYCLHSMFDFGGWVTDWWHRMIIICCLI